MVYDIDMLRNFYANFPRRVDTAREPWPRKSYMRIYTMKTRLAFSKEVRIM